MAVPEPRRELLGSIAAPDDGLRGRAIAGQVGVDLAEANRQLQSDNLTLLRLCGELSAEQNRLIERTATLEDANRDLASFDYSVAHDLRAPLRAIDGFSRALLEDYGEQLDAPGRHLLERVRGGSQRMAELIDALLMLANCTGRPPQRTLVDLSALAREVAAELARASPGRQVALDIAPDLLASADAAVLRIALVNLLGNAWKFTRARPRAVIAVGAVAGSTPPLFFVRDNGVGFDMAHAAHLFSPFVRLHAATEFEGTGVGLATVQRIIERHGGSLWAESRVGNGATFFFTLPEESASA